MSHSRNDVDKIRDLLEALLREKDHRKNDDDCNRNDIAETKNRRNCECNFEWLEDGDKIRDLFEALLRKKDYRKNDDDCNRNDIAETKNRRNCECNFKWLENVNL